MVIASQIHVEEDSVSVALPFRRGLIALLFACSICACGVQSESATEAPRDIGPGSASSISPARFDDPPFPQPPPHLRQEDIRGELGRAWHAMFDGDPPAPLRRAAAPNGNKKDRWYPIEAAPVTEDIYAVLIRAVPDHPDAGEGGMMPLTFMYLERAGDTFRLLTEHEMFLPVSRPVVHRRNGRSILEFRRFSREADRECVETSFVALERTGPSAVATSLLLDYVGRDQSSPAREVVAGRLAGAIALSDDGKQFIATHRGTVGGQAVDERRSWALGASPPPLRAIAPHSIDEQGYCIRDMAAAP